MPFVLPPFLLVTAVAIFYAEYQGLSLVHAVFLGVGPAVLAIIAIAGLQARPLDEQDRPRRCGASPLVLCGPRRSRGAEIVWLFLLAGAFGAVYYGGGFPRAGRRDAVSPARAAGGGQGIGLDRHGASLGVLGLFFFKAGAFTFGSGLAIVPFLHAGLVDDHHWLTEQQFVDAVAMGLISPGPVVIMATFAGYLVYGITGAIVATILVSCRVAVRRDPRPLSAATRAIRGCRASSRARPPRPRRDRRRAIVIAGDVIDSGWSVVIASSRSHSAPEGAQGAGAVARDRRGPRRSGGVQLDSSARRAGPALPFPSQRRHA